jgi:hypothetical protein
MESRRQKKRSSAAYIGSASCSSGAILSYTTKTGLKEIEGKMKISAEHGSPLSMRARNRAL